MLLVWTNKGQCYSPPLNKLGRYLKFCYRNSTALLSDLESPLNTVWRIVRSGFCLITGGLDKIGYSEGITDNIENIDDYNKILSQYKSYKNKTEISFYKNPDSFNYNVPKLYKDKVIPLILQRFNSYNYLINDLPKLNYLINNINDTQINWKNLSISNEIYNNTNNTNLNSKDFSLDQIINVAEKLNIDIFKGYKVKTKN